MNHQSKAMRGCIALEKSFVRNWEPARINFAKASEVRPRFRAAFITADVQTKLNKALTPQFMVC